MTAKKTKKPPRHHNLRNAPWLERGETEPPQGLADQMDLFINQPDGDSNVRPLPKEFQDLILVTELERSIAASSQVTMKVRDPGRALFKAGYFSPTGRPDLLMDGLWFRAVLYEKVQADEFSIQFEDREIAIARQYRKPYSFQAHGEVNPRASFIKNLLKKAVPHAPFFCPDLIHERARIKPIKSKEKPTGPHVKAELKRAKQITHSYMIEGSKADAQQRQNIETLLEVADNLHAPPTVRVALICAAIGESTLHSDGPNNLNSLGYWGVLQGRSRQTSEGPGYWPNRYDSKGMAEAFLKGGKGFKSAIQLYKEGVTDPGAIAEKAEGSGAGPTFYSKHRGDAEAIIREYSGSPHTGGTTVSPTTGEVERTHQGQPLDKFKFPKGEQKEGEEPESAWDCAKSYADELKWRLFCRAGRFYLVSDDYLKKGHGATVEENDRGVVDIRWTIDLASREHNPPHMDIDARAHLWQAAPGEVITIRGLRQGKDIHEGLWLVSDIHRPDITDNAVTITLERPEHPLAETAIEVPPSVNLPGAPPTSAATPEGPTGGLGPGLRLPAASIAFWEHNLAQNHPETKSRIRWVVARVLAAFEEYKNTPRKLVITATTNGNHVSGSYHYKGMAMDLATQNGDQKMMDTVGAWCEQYLRGYLTEGIHNPTLAVKNGKQVQGSVVYKAVWEGHKDHIHIAVAENAPLERGRSGAFGGAGILNP